MHMLRSMIFGPSTIRVAISSNLLNLLAWYVLIARLMEDNPHLIDSGWVKVPREVWGRSRSPHNFRDGHDILGNANPAIFFISLSTGIGSTTNSGKRQWLISPQLFEPSSLGSHANPEWYINKRLSFSSFLHEIVPTPASWVRTTGHLIFYRRHEKALKTLLNPWLSIQLEYTYD